MYIDATFTPDGSARLADLLRMAGALQPDDIAIAVDALIAQLDARAGDPDIEDDDPAGGDITDEPHNDDGDEEDDEDDEDDGAKLRARHLNRIRRTRCKEVRNGRYVTGYRLSSPLRVMGGRRA